MSTVSNLLAPVRLPGSAEGQKITWKEPKLSLTCPEWQDLLGSHFGNAPVVRPVISL